MVLIKRLIGQGVTDVNGECSVSYVGEGTGILNIKSEAPERMISSEIYEGIDAKWFDDFSSDTRSKYYYNPIGGTGITYENGYLVLTSGTSGRYVRLRTSQYSYSDYIGKTVTVRAELEFEGNETHGVSIYENSTGSHREYSKRITSSGLVEVTREIPSNASEVLFQVSDTGTTNGNVTKIKSFTVYYS